MLSSGHADAPRITSRDFKQGGTTMRGLALTGTMLTALCAGAQAADQVKLGLMTPLSGRISPGGPETKRGAALALEQFGNKLGGLPVKCTVAGDKTNPAEAVQG